MNEPTTDTATEPKKRRSGWWFLAKLSLGLLVLVVGTLLFWIRSDGDLRTARERVAAAGFPTTGAEMGRKKSDEARIAAWLRLEASFAYKAPLASYFDVGQLNKFATPGTALPEALVTAFGALSPATVADALALIDELGDGPLVSEVAFSVTTRIYGNSRLASFAIHHALLCPASELPTTLRRLLRISTWYDPDSLYSGQSRAYVLSRLMQALLYRRADLAREQREHFASQLHELTADPGHFLARTQAANLVMDLDFYLDPDDRSRRGGRMMPKVLEWPLVGLLLYRAGRGPLMQQELDWAIFLRDHRDDLRAIIADARRRQPMYKDDWTLLLDPSMLLTHMTSRMCYASNWCESVAKTRLRAELVAAVLRDEPWPVDWFDPTGAKLRPITIDGKVTGAYSVGPDGVDDGGTSNKDVRWALFGPLDPPKP